jgi:predicted nuclease of predicted toxin-antitoxin system
LRFLADENFPRAAVAALEAAGHDIVWVRLAAPGAADADVLAAAARESRILLTFDWRRGRHCRRAAGSRSCVFLRQAPTRRVGVLLLGSRRETIGTVISRSSSPAA